MFRFMGVFVFTAELLIAPLLCGATNPSSITGKPAAGWVDDWPAADPSPSADRPEARPAREFATNIGARFGSALAARRAGPPKTSLPNTLRGLSQTRGFLVGAALQSWMIAPAIARSAGLVTPYLDLIKSQFNVLAPEVELKWERIQPKAPKFDPSGQLVPAPAPSDDFNLGPANALFQFASDNRFTVHGHTLLYSANEPKWLTGCASSGADPVKCTTPWTVSQLRQILKYHVQTLVGYYKHNYPHVTVLWDLVNEPNYSTSGYLSGAATPRTSVFEQIPDPASGKPSTTYYQILAANYALQADPDVKLCLNDAFIEDLDSFSARNMYYLARTIQQAGVPLYCVGFETHLLLSSYNGSANSPSKRTLIETMQRYWGLGLKVLISEMDVALPLVGQFGKGATPAPVPQPATSAAHYWPAQARMYSDAMSACLEAPNCIGFITWNFNPVDSYLSSTRSWGIARYGLPKGYSSDPLPFDSSNRPKPAYDAMRSALVKAVNSARILRPKGDAGRYRISPGGSLSLPLDSPVSGLQDIHVMAAACASPDAVSPSGALRPALQVSLDSSPPGSFSIASTHMLDYTLQASVRNGTRPMALFLDKQSQTDVCVDLVWLQPSASFSSYLTGFQFTMTGSGYRWAGDQRVTLTASGAALATTTPVTMPRSGVYEILWSGWASVVPGGRIELDVDNTAAASFEITDTRASGSNYYRDYRVLLNLNQGPHSICWLNRSTNKVQITMDHMLVLAQPDGSVYMPARGMETAPSGGGFGREVFSSTGMGFQDTIAIPATGTYQISVTSASHQIVSSAGAALSDYGQGEVFVDGISLGRFASLSDGWNTVAAGKPISLSSGSHTIRVLTTNLQSQGDGFVNNLTMAIQSVTVAPATGGARHKKATP